LRNIDRILHEDDWIVVGVRDAGAAEPPGSRGECARTGAVGERIHLARLTHVPVLTELAGQIAARRPERQDSGARQEVVQRFLLNWIDAETARASVSEELEPTLLDPSHETQTALSLVHAATSRTNVALHTTIGKRLPVARIDGPIANLSARLMTIFHS